MRFTFNQLFLLSLTKHMLLGFCCTKHMKPRKIISPYCEFALEQLCVFPYTKHVCVCFFVLFNETYIDHEDLRERERQVKVKSDRTEARSVNGLGRKACMDSVAS